MIISNGWYSISAAAALLAFNVSAAPSPQEATPSRPPSALRSTPAPENTDDRSPDSDPGGLQFRLVKPIIQPGERTTLEIEMPLATLEAAGWNDESGPPTVNDDFLTQSKAFQILDTTYRRTNHSLIWGYELTAHSTGAVTLPPVEIRVGSQTFSTEATLLKIATTRAEGDTKIRDEFGPLDPPSKLWYWLMWLSLLPLAYYAGLWIEKRLPKWLSRFKPKPIAVVAPTEEDPIEWLKRELLRLKVELSQGATEAFADELTAVLREYFARKHKAPVRAWTTKEFTHRFAAEPTATALVPVFTSCDEIKFTGRKANLADRFATAFNETERVLLACGT